jgi:ferredoxin
MEMGMIQRTISKERVAELINGLMEDSSVIAPVYVGEQAFFRPITSPDQIRWDFANTTVSPTEYLLPQSEALLHFERRGSEVNLTYELDETKRTIIGIRPCDVHSLRMLDRVFEGNYPDPYYLTRRKNTTLIALMCAEPGESCFCSSFGTGPDLDEAAGADMLFVDLDDVFLVKAFSAHGEALVEHFSSLFAPATDVHEQAVEEVRTSALNNMARHLDTEGLSETLGSMFDSPYWEKISRKCLACGACTYLCPVCYCFDVSETCSRDSGTRTRCWDACTYRSFAMLSGGHNPRPSIAEGYRQKMYHKFNYAVQRYHEQLCVGCGRCLDSCPVHLDIVRVLSEAKEYSV